MALNLFTTLKKMLHTKVLLDTNFLSNLIDLYLIQKKQRLICFCLVNINTVIKSEWLIQGISSK